MKDTYLKLLAEHIKEVRKVEARLLKDFEFNGGDITTLGNTPAPCPKAGEIRNSEGICIKDPGIG